MLVDQNGKGWTGREIRDTIQNILVEYYWEAAYDDFIAETGLDDCKVQEFLEEEGL